MWIVRLALRRPYTFVVAALLLLLLTPFALLQTPTDIFPSINIPVVSIIWQYTGLSAKEIEQRMVYTHERALTTTVNNIEHIESTSYDGVAVVKVFFHQGVSPDAAVAQITAGSQTILKQLPPGTTAWPITCGGRDARQGPRRRMAGDDETMTMRALTRTGGSDLCALQ
jgi:multidrug efflux pump subunit AcrB